VQLTLEGKTKDQVAIERIQAFEPPEGYYLAFSGGKDSVTLLALAKMAGVKFDAHYNLTTVDPPPLVKFIREQHPEVEIVRPKKTMWQLIDEHGTLPTRMVRFCCEDLKEVGGVGRLCLTGIRWAESPRRANRNLLEMDKRRKNKRFLHPILDWTDDDVWQYIRERNLPYCSMYDEGWKRLGCVLCPMAAPSSIQREIERFPKIVRAWHNAALRVYQRGGKMSHWQSGDDYFNWWLSREGLRDSQQATFSDCTVPFSD
jgi:phosphoadenosine phosphosulfate reductase